MKKLKYKIKYYLRKLAIFLGRCPKRWTTVNYTITGQPICPNCGH